MKRVYLIFALVSLVMMSACVKDLEKFPLNESDFTADKAYDDTQESYARGLAKIYGGFALAGQMGVNGAPEISVTDGGASEMIRSWWSLQEVSSDAAKVAWVNDAWVREVNFVTWTTFKNDAMAAIYERFTLMVTLVNEFLRQTTEEQLDARGVDATLKSTVNRYRAEARFLRAYCYWMAMDAFGNPPFTTEEDPLGTFFPPQIRRADLFDWIEGELLALSTSGDLPAMGQASYPQVDKGAVWGLLARMYLNAKVYTGQERWADAKSAASQVIAGPYALAPVYRHLFMGDNGDHADTRGEFIFVIAYDLEETQSFGGTPFLVNSTLANPEEGVHTTGSKGWGGPRTTFEYVQRHFDVSGIDYATGAFNCDDERAMFYIKDRKQEMNDPGLFPEGWSVVKYSRYYRTTDLANPVVPPGDFNDADFPMMRLAEMYLIYAEAAMRGGTIDATGLGYLNDLRERAGLPRDRSESNVDLNYILDERGRELMWEAHRRTDLIRYDLFTGGAYLWPWKGGVKTGRAIDAHYNLCPLLQDDVDLNENLTQNPGYIK